MDGGAIHLFLKSKEKKMNKDFSMKELYSVELKTTYPIEINGRFFESGETICFFDKIQLANFNEIQEHVAAKGGYNNEGRVFWDTTKEMRVAMRQGVFSKEQLSFMNNAKLLELQKNNPILISSWEELESDEKGKFTLKKQPENKIFVYSKETGEKLSYRQISSKQFEIDSPYTDLKINYNYHYENGASLLSIGKKATTGFLVLQGRTRIQEDKTGITKTGIIYIPKLKLVSDLSIRLGKEAQPVVDSLEFVAYPTGERGNTRVMELYFLEDDIDSDF